MKRLVPEIIFDVVQSVPDRVALEINIATSRLDVNHSATATFRWTYAELGAYAESQAEFIRASLTTPHTPIFIWADKSFEMYGTVLASWLLRCPFVPIYPRLPKKRIIELMKKLGGGVIVGDSTTFPLEASELERCSTHLIEYKQSSTAQVSTAELEHSQCPEDLAYIIFTSGSTGVPKAVSITHGNLIEFYNASKKCWDFNLEDRFTQIYELSFDPAIADIVWAFSNGATLLPFSSLNLPGLPHYLKTLKPTVVGMAPSIAHMLLSSGSFNGHTFPEIRISAFIGEILTQNLTATWAKLAPNSWIENHYGPAEATISVSRYRLPKSRDESSDSTQADHSVPIGWPHAGIEFALVDSAGAVMHRIDGSAKLNSISACIFSGNYEGELFIHGQQLSPGYVGDLKATAEKFVYPAWDLKRRWYRTGDLVSTSECGLTFMRRVDRQVKIKGQRVELGELETRVTRVLGTGFKHSMSTPDQRVPRFLAAFGWPLKEEGGHYESWVTVFDSALASQVWEQLRFQLSDELTPALMPVKWLSVAEPPLNSSGKLDRAALLLKLIATS